jgi:hypothetical protein
MKFKVNPKGLKAVKQGANEAWGETMAALELKMEEVIRDPNAFSEQGFVEQDIVDTERFVNSQQVQVVGGVTSFSWNPHDPETGYPYAPALYAGFMAYGKKWIPARHWPEKAIDELDVTEDFKRNLNERGAKARVKIKNKVYL